MPDRLMRPVDTTDLATGRALHKECGGSVGKRWGYDARGCWRCDKCCQQWSVDTMSRFGEQELAERFHTEVKPHFTTEALVWVVDPVTKWRHTKLVPVYQAEGMERVKS